MAYEYDRFEDDVPAEKEAAFWKGVAAGTMGAVALMAVSEVVIWVLEKRRDDRLWGQSLRRQS